MRGGAGIREDNQPASGTCDVVNRVQPPLIVLACALALGCTRAEPATVAIATPTVADAGAPKVDAGGAPAPLPGKIGFFPSVLGVTRDGKRALVRFHDMHGSIAPPPFRWIDIATNTMIDEWTLPALHGLPIETMNEGASPTIRSNPALTTPALEADIVKHATALLSLDVATDERFAVSPNAVVFNVGDWLNVADPHTGKVGARLSSDASYYPQITKSGAFVVYSREQGLLDGVVGNYMPFIAPLPGGAPSRRLEVRDVDGEAMRISPDGIYLYVQSGHELPENGCLVRVTLAAPSPTKKLFCVPAGDRIDGVRFSPSRTFAVVMARTGRVGPVRSTWIHLPDGAKMGDLQLGIGFHVATVDDLGVGIAGGLTPGGPGIMLLDPLSHRFDQYATGTLAPPSFYGAAWLSGDRIVLGEGGGVKVIDFTKTVKTSLPWPTGPYVPPPTSATTGVP